MSFGFDDTFNVSPWSAPPAPTAPWRPDFADDQGLKRAYGISLAKEADAFAAGLVTFNQEVSKALWASKNWVDDEIVIAARDEYKAVLKEKNKPLDKTELLTEILNLARSGIEAKDAVAALKLYSEVAGYTGNKIDINSITNNNTTNNKFVSIKLVRPEKQDQIIEASNQKSEMLNDVGLPKLKLVGGLTT